MRFEDVRHALQSESFGQFLAECYPALHNPNAAPADQMREVAQYAAEEIVKITAYLMGESDAAISAAAQTLGEVLTRTARHRDWSQAVFEHAREAAIEWLQSVPFPNQ